MMDRIVNFSIEHRGFVVLAAVGVVVAGLWAAVRLPIDAVPDITNKQVQINTIAPGLAPVEVEQQVTFPLETALSGLPHLKQMRSISQFGLSQVTLVFEDHLDIYFIRQLVLERLQDAKDQLPPGIETPKMTPISSGLGEIFYLFVEGNYSLMDRRTILDWEVKPRLRTVPGIIDVNSYGGQEQQYQVLVDPERLWSYGLTLRQIQQALLQNNRNAGGGYLERGDEQELVRGVGLIRNEDDIRNIVVAAHDGTPVYLRDVAEVTVGPAPRQGALTKDGQGEAVVGITMLLLGENSRTVVQRVKEKVVEIQKTLPPGFRLTGCMDRAELVGRTLHTAAKNLLEGGALVILILFLFLRQWRAGLIVSSAIPLAMLCALIGMQHFHISANLMSLGAIDFGLIVDAAVIIVENCVRRLAEQRRALQRDLTPEERLATIRAATLEVRRASQFGEMVIIAAYIPILSLQEMEGKMFKPMAFTVIFALIGALVLSLTLIPALCALFLGTRVERDNPLMTRLQAWYRPLLRQAMRFRYATVGTAILFFLSCLSLFPRLGSEFLPELDEGALAIATAHLPSVSVEEAVHRASLVEKVLMTKFSHEVESAITRIGRAEIATDPMLLSQTCMVIPLKPRSEWRAARTREELVARMEEALSIIPGMKMSFSQPIKLRMMELIEGTGVQSDVAIKLFGPNLDLLRQKAQEIADVVKAIPGGKDVMIDQTVGLPSLEIQIRREEIARYGLNVEDVQNLVEAIGGQAVGQVVQGNRRFDLVVRFAEPYRRDAEAISRLLLDAPDGSRVPLAHVADIRTVEGPTQVKREHGERCIVIQVNIRGRDLGSYVEEARTQVEHKVKLPPGYYMEWAGTYEHLVAGRNRLLVVVPITFGLIFLLIYMTYGRAFDAVRVFTGIPFAISGGILALYLRGMHFSMSAGVGFIALSGVAVLADMVMVSTIRRLLDEGRPLREAVEQAALTRLRPVLMTAMVASFGFLPMALSHSPGAEIQRPLATVVIGGLITSTVLTLFVLPTLYVWIGRGVKRET